MAKERREKEKLNIETPGLWGRAHNWPSVRGRTAAHPPFSLHLPTCISPQPPVALPADKSDANQ